MESNKDILCRLQQAQIEILCHIDEVCGKHGIKYSLYAGTLLGAVRHKDFIPWDDDLDICMTRKEYEHFLQVWDEEPHDGFILQNKDDSPEFSQSFTKIRKDHTTFLEFEGEESKEYHKGIFVDVFPIDRMPGGTIKKLQFKWNCMKYQLYTREFLPEKSNSIVKLISGVLLKIVPKNKRASIRSKLLKRITKYNSNTALRMVGIETMSSIKHPYEPTMLKSYTQLQFGSRTFMCDENWDSHLRCKFGDYMQLPPEEERVWKHHPILIDFEHNYEELVKEGKV